MLKRIEKLKNVNMNSKIDLFSIAAMLQDNYYWLQKEVA